ncbi:NUDIX hydrolase [Clostridium sp. 'White wine YQ']|uniref:NUDIX hydrolase n=1 Tax=Clostridium sp. 'White wine YQ' TaxID=3027474 RepID=UPI00236652FE|nr:NUDIX domain-containing protein [Clostridium sp. 'White wine YQ']MDD7794387.1 NUDIX domain-containing protein [Clostridium sp. 'White wine YQ']
MELWDVYDINRNKTDKTMVRGEPFKKDEYHLVVHICIFNSKGEMLIQQRQPFKEGWPNMWDITVGGSAIKGDTSQTAAERELFEEIGLKVDLKNIRPHITINFEDGFDDYYIIEREVDLNELSLQYEEVQKVKWASKEEIFSMIESGEFIPYYQSLIQLLFDIRKQYGSNQTK